MDINILWVIIISFVLNMIYTNLKVNEELDEFAEDILATIDEMFEYDENNNNEE